MQKVNWIDLGGVNCYLVENNQKFMLIDTGGHMFMDKTFDDRLILLKSKLEEYGVTKENLQLLLLTHGDCDHVCNAAYIKDTFGVPVAIGEADVNMISAPTWDCYKVNSKYSSKVFALVFRLINSKIEALMKKVYSEFQTVQPDVILKEGMTLSQFGFSGTVYETPGHTKGSISVLDEDGNLFCGDLFANNKKPSLAVNAEDFNVMKTQAKRLLKLPVKMIYPGHGQPFEKEKY